VPREPLVEHVPGRETEPRLEDRHDPEREQDEAEEEARRARRVAAADSGMSLYSWNGLKGFEPVATSTPFVSR
jgi:hypothetical protein